MGTSRCKIFKKLLIANRGEIAVRIMRAAKEMRIESVAIYSDCDRKALHVRSADEAYPLHGNAPQETYLNIEKIITIAKNCGASAIHPGYGFLSENEEFAKECENNGIVFVGPTPETMRRMGDKVGARKTAKENGVPVIPGSEDAISDLEEAKEFAKKIGFPVMLKARAGGGGKGMRMVRSEDEIESAFRLASSEAKTAFGDPSLYIEKAVQKPCHVEVQIIGDSYGNVIHLWERDCSIQRRHQKIVEESPSPSIGDPLRRKIVEAAVRMAKAVGYINAGTVEFLVEGENFYFLEVNARLQVEHPITERVTGIDLVKKQFMVACGEKLDVEQENIKRLGHAFEFRIYAEDPFNNFAPSPGLIKEIKMPGGFGVRVDTGVYPGYEVPIYYDPILMKVIIWDETRDKALVKAERVLSELQIRGIQTNIPFHLWLLNQSAFRAGKYWTRFIEETFKALKESEEDLEKFAIAASIRYLEEIENKKLPLEKSQPISKWKIAGRMEVVKRL